MIRRLVLLAAGVLALGARLAEAAPPATGPATAAASPGTQPRPASGPAAPPKPAPMATPHVDTAVELALLHLARAQHADGHFQAEPKVALTALALTSYVASGHAPDLGRHGGTVRRALNYLVRAAPADGYFGAADGSRMYGQAIVVIALCQAYGLEQDSANRAAMRAVLAKAVSVIVAAQGVKKDAVHAGGWRYEPGSADSDLSATAWNAVALRAARDIGLDVPDAALAAAAAYVKRCARPGGFAYQPAGEAGAAMTAAGMLALALLEADRTPEFAAGATHLRDHPPGGATRFPYYATYYASQAAHQAGGEAWRVVSRASRERLLRAQLPSGAWPQSTSPEEPGEIYATAMAVLTLSVPKGVLPLYQR